jgi:hypothetical protein
MKTDSLIKRLSKDLHPVRPRSLVQDALVLAVLGLVEVAIFLGMGFMRPDMPVVMDKPSFWWKLVSMGLVAVLGAGIALISIDPVRSPRRGLRWILALVALVFATGWLIDASQGGVAHLLARIDWHDGIQCTWKMVALSVPPAIGLGFLIRRGAPSDRTGTALAAALAAAGWGAFVFVFACPSDDPLYIAVWYTVGCGFVTVIGRFVLSRIARW